MREKPRSAIASNENAPSFAPGDMAGRRVAVVGAGPAGLMAAQQLAIAGCRVEIFERMPSAGRKFLMAGRGGLNLTHSETFDDFVARYGPATHWLRPALDAFPPTAMNAWAADLGEPTFVGSSGRVFPKGFKTSPLLRAWLERLNALGVRLHPRHRWTGWTDSGALRFETSGPGPLSVDADATVLALGGASWPRLGSDGVGLTLLTDAGVGTVPFTPFNAGAHISWSELLIAKFEGAPVKRVAVSCGGETVKGDVVITRRGLEGGPIYALNRGLKAALQRSGQVSIEIDLRPDLNLPALTERLSRPRNNQSWSTFLRKTAGFSPVSIALGREPQHGILPDEPGHLAKYLKSVPLVVEALADFDKAISSSGGVTRESIDDHFMLKTIPGTFIVGEMLDWDAPTGGYLLQATLATAVYAAAGVERYLKENADSRAPCM